MILHQDAKKKAITNFLTLERRLKDIHGDKYDYSKSIYKCCECYIEVYCNTCLKTFTTTMCNHTKKVEPRGCPSCGILKRSKSQTHSQEYILLKVKEMYPTLDFSNSVYAGIDTPMQITCLVDGATYTKDPYHLINRNQRGCPICPSTSGFSKAKPAILYLFRIKGIYKLGVTNRTVKERYNIKDIQDISNILTWEFETGQEAYDREQYLIEHYKQYAYTGPTPFTDGTGITECFTEDIYKLWEKENE